MIKNFVFSALISLSHPISVQETADGYRGIHPFSPENSTTNDNISKLSCESFLIMLNNLNDNKSDVDLISVWLHGISSEFLGTAAPFNRESIIGSLSLLRRECKISPKMTVFDVFSRSLHNIRNNEKH